MNGQGIYNFVKAPLVVFPQIIIEEWSLVVLTEAYAKTWGMYNVNKAYRFDYQ